MFERLFAKQAMFIPVHTQSGFAGVGGKHKKYSDLVNGYKCKKEPGLAPSQFRTVIQVIKLHDMFLYGERSDAIHSNVRTHQIVQPHQLEK